MKDSFLKIQQIGRQLTAQLSRWRLGAEEFAELAEQALRNCEPIEAPTLAEIVEFLCSDAAPPQSDSRFSDVPLIVFRNSDFYIELLTWMHATTTIHAHGFAGAFKVLHGSSLHTPWRLTNLNPINRDLALVDAHQLPVEQLRTGMVRRILPGDQGLIHSLYHLESPSVSLVIRIPGERNQFSLLRPALWFNELALSLSDRVKAIDRVVGGAERVSPGSGKGILLGLAKYLELGTLVYLLNAHQRLIDKPELIVDALKARSDVPAALAVAIGDSLVHARQVDLITRARASILDPDLRFFLALLLNVSDRAAIMEIIAAAVPGQEPRQTCAKWLVALAQYRGDPTDRLARIAAAAAMDFRIGVGLREAIGPELVDAVAVDLVVSVLGLDDSASTPHDRRAGGSEQEVLALRTRLQNLPLLAALFD